MDDTDADIETDPAERRRARRRTVASAAAPSSGVMSRAALADLGLTRAQVRAELAAGRWRAVGRHCILTTTGDLTAEQRHHVAVLEAGPRGVVDGESALVLAGLRRFEPRAVRVSVPRGARVRTVGADVDIRQTRRWADDDVVPGSSPPRTRPPVATVRAALWARSEREATLLVTMAVQQRLVTLPALAEELLRVRRDRRRGLVQGLLGELADGVGSLGELDVVRGCRARGLPEPESQVRRPAAGGGSCYLDFRWRRWAVVLEVDGVQHSWAEQLVGDSLRHNAIAMTGDVVLRLPVIGLRLCPDAFFDQVRQALRAAGWADPTDVVRDEGHDRRSA